MKSNENFFGSFGKTAWSFYFTSNSFLNIAYGAVRSGKTIVATYRFLKFILNSSENKFLIVEKVEIQYGGMYFTISQKY